MKRSFRSTTYEDVIAYAQDLIEELREKEEYLSAVSRAEALGYAITATVRHTYTEDFAASYTPNPDATGPIPVGYAMELWFDITAAGHVLVTNGETPVQCSVSALAAETSGVFLIRHLKLLTLDEVLDHTPVAAMLEEYLDALEEEGYALSPFVTDALAPVSPRGGDGVINLARVEDGSYVELSRMPYDGSFGREDSLYLSRDAFLPYRLFLLGITGRSTDFEGAYLLPDIDTTEAFLEILDEIPHAIRNALNFDDLYSALLDSPLAPTPRAEQLLDALTICRRNAFLDDCERIADFIREQLADENTITILW